MKLCECGCGEPAPIAKMTRRNSGRIKGQPVRFISGHNNRGSASPNWNGGKTISGSGYIQVLRKNHPKTNQKGYVTEHILITEKVLGKPLPTKAKIHHVDGNRLNNNKDNLVICQDTAYHALLHRRKRAYGACGHVDWVKCWICKQYDDPKNMYIYQNRPEGRHRECQNKYNSELLAKK